MMVKRSQCRLRRRAKRADSIGPQREIWAVAIDRSALVLDCGHSVPVTPTMNLDGPRPMKMTRCHECLSP
jgi:hypothetical protein